MGIIIFALAMVLFSHRLKKTDSKTRIGLWLALFGYAIFSIILNTYLKYVFGWEYGVPGADLTAHFNGAQAISEGTPLKNLEYVNYRFALQPSNIGYLIYAYFLAFVAFCPTIISIQFSLYLFYLIQAMAAISGCLNIAEFVEPHSKKGRNAVLLMLLFCTSLLQMASVLMRDIWIVFFISLLMRYMQKEKVNHILCILLMLLSAIMRSYTLVITVPLYVAYGLKKEKLGVIASIGMFIIFFAGQNLINQLVRFYSVLWDYSFKFDFISIVEYIMFPNIISQTHNVQHMTQGYHAIHGGNTEWIYYLLACWNVFVFPVVVYGVVKTVKERKFFELGIWGMIILNIAMLYSVFYSSVSEPRHKLLLLYSLAFFFAKGVKELKMFLKIFSFLIIIIFLLFLLMVIY
jgi:hypothetical protein